MKRFALISLMLVCLAMAFAVTIHDVQFTTAPGTDNTYPSLYAGQPVTVTGIVTCNTYGTTSTGPDPKFFIEDPAGGPWSGIYVFRFGTGVQIGDLVSVSSTVSEYYGFTELGGNGTTVSIISSQNQLPAPALIPTSTLANPANPAAAEQWEGVLCRYADVTVETAPDTHQEFYVNDGSGQGQVDDAAYQYPHTWSGIAVGNHYANITGVVDYSFNLYGLNPRSDADIMVTPNSDPVVLPAAKLLGNFPNPFAGTTEIALNLKQAQHVTLNVYNLKGEKVRTLVNGNLKAQLHNFTFDGKDDNGNTLSAGVYMYQMQTQDKVETRKLVIR